MIIAHKDEKGREQLLYNHLINVGNGCYKLGKEVNIEHISLLVGLLHDIGKADPLFQEMIKTGKNIKVNHSSAGAKFLFDMQLELLDESDTYREVRFVSYIEVLMYVIEAHHGVFNILTYDKKIVNNLYKRIRYDIDSPVYNYNKVKDYAKVINNYSLKDFHKSLKEILIVGYSEYRHILDLLNIEDNDFESVEFYYYNHCIIRLVLSILKNEDIFDTVNAYESVVVRKTSEEIEELITDFYLKIEDEYASYPPATDRLNQVRKNISDQIRFRCDRDSNGIYKLDLPTGAGKTKLSLLYSLHQLKNKKRNKMIYIAPFLSILEQNALEYRHTLDNDKYILEHHSNLSYKDSYQYEDYDNDNNAAMIEYTRDSWDQVVVLSTMVQFVNTLFKSKSSNLRRFFNLSNSVIVLDEIQSLPYEMTHNFNLMINFISKAMNSIIILCSATQPTLNHYYINHKILYGGSNGEDSNLIHLDYNQLAVFDRVEINLLNDGDKSSINHIYKFILNSEIKSTLVILNTKKAVESLYNMLQVEPDYQENIFYITTHMCPKHRLDVISEIREKLANDVPVLVISTSLIEAGINLDFKRVFRSYAGFDSIIQALGRCNREGKYEKGEAYLVNLNEDEENLSNLLSIRKKKEVTEEILDEYNGPFKIDVLNNKYYDKLYSNNPNLDMDISMNESLLELLSSNSTLRYADGSKKLNIQSFKTASDNFQLIDDESESVIVYYGQSFVLIENLISAIEDFRGYDGNKERIEEIKHLINELQPYTINIYNSTNIQDKLIKIDGLDLFGVKILNESNYDQRTGYIEESKLDSFFL